VGQVANLRPIVNRPGVDRYFHKTSNYMSTVLPAIGLSRARKSPWPLLAGSITRGTFIVADCLAVLAAYAVTVLLRTFTGGSGDLWQNYLRLTPFLAIVPVMIGLLGLYPGVLLNPIEELRRLSIAMSVGMSLVVVATFLIKESSSYSRAVFLLAVPLGVALAAGGRWLVRRCCAGASWWGLPAVLIGPESGVADVWRAVESNSSAGVHFVKVVMAESHSLPLELDRETIGRRIPYAVVVLPPAASPEWLLQVEQLAWQCEKFIVIPQSKGFMWSWMTARDCGGITGLEVRRELLRSRARLAKDFMDCLLAVFGGILIAPLIAIVAVVIRLTSHGPAF